MAVLIFGAITVGWIVLRLLTPARWQEFGFLGAIVLAVIPALMGLRQDPTVQTVVLPIAGGLVLGDIVLRLVQWCWARLKRLHERATRSSRPRSRSSSATNDESPRRRRSSSTSRDR